MKALTILQPWATLLTVVFGFEELRVKQFETRSWWTSYRGPLAIHAGKSTKYLHLCNEEPFRSVLITAGRGTEKHGVDVGLLPLGAVIATSELAGYLRIPDSRVNKYIKTNEQVKLELAFGDWSSGRYAWRLDNVKELPEPIPAKGKQGLWEWDEGGVKVG